MQPMLHRTIDPRAIRRRNAAGFVIRPLLMSDNLRDDGLGHAVAGNELGALFIAGDSRTQGDPDKLKFCGAGALNVIDRDSYAVLMRIALLSSLKAADTTANLGFRCAKDATGEGR